MTEVNNKRFLIEVATVFFTVGSTSIYRVSEMVELDSFICMYVLRLLFNILKMLYDIITIINSSTESMLRTDVC